VADDYSAPLGLIGREDEGDGEVHLDEEGGAEI